MLGYFKKKTTVKEPLDKPTNKFRIFLNPNPDGDYLVERYWQDQVLHNLDFSEWRKEKRFSTEKEATDYVETFVKLKNLLKEYT